jgi:hypothetical protein
MEILWHILNPDSTKRTNHPIGRTVGLSAFMYQNLYLCADFNEMRYI